MSIYELLGVFLLLLIAVLLSVPRYEFFADAIQQDFLKLKPSQTNTVQLYQSSSGETNYLKTLSSKPLPFEQQLLVMDRCLKFKIEGNDLKAFDRNMELLFKDVVFPVMKDSFEVTHYAELETRIMQNLQRVYSKNSLKQLNGPIYALIFQAPYLRIIEKDCKVRSLNIQYNVKAYENTSYSIGYEKTKPNELSVEENCIGRIGEVNRQKVNVLVYLLFPTYNKSYKFVYRNWDNIQCNMRSIIDKRSFEGPCFLKCYEQGENKTCGCLNQDEPYKATCLSDNKNDLTRYNYGNLYLINSEEASRRVNGTLGTSFFGENVQIKAFDPKALDLYRCSLITRTPFPIQNISS